MSRRAPLEMGPEEFRRLGKGLVDKIADWLAEMPEGPVTPAEEPATVRALIDKERPLPETGEDAGALLEEAAGLLFGHSLFNGHPRFYGYITSSAAPIGALADMLAAAVNPNVGSYKLGPMATEVEGQTVRWIAELLGYPADAGGVLVSGGNMANFLGFLAGRTAMLGQEVREEGLPSGARVYASEATHTWIHNAADLFGSGLGSISWIPVDGDGRMRMDALGEAVDADRAADRTPFMVIGAAGAVGTGAVDPLAEIADLCEREGLWFHVDGAYGGFAACVPGADGRLDALGRADSVAVDPHKWLYAPLEAGCALVKDPAHLVGAFSYRPDYYNFEAEALSYYEWGMQNSRGFRALKVWLCLRQAGRAGYERMIGDDIRLAERLYAAAAAHPEVEAGTRHLSIATFRVVPEGVDKTADAEYLDDLNREVLDRLERGGEAFVSNAVVDGVYWLRACIVNFRTDEADVDYLPEQCAAVGRQVHAERRP